MTTKKEVEAMICNMSGSILLGNATEKEIEKVVNLAKEHDLLPLVHQEFSETSGFLRS